MPSLGSMHRVHIPLLSLTLYEDGMRAINLAINQIGTEGQHEKTHYKVLNC